MDVPGSVRLLQDAQPLTEDPRGALPAAASVQDRLWVLLGSRRGDNNQLLAAAQMLGLPLEVIHLRFKRRSLPNVLLGATLSPLEDRRVLPDGFPRLVLSIGRRSVPIARWLRKQSGGATRIVHFGRPWGRTSWFDLVVTTAQYRLRPAANVLCNALPFVSIPRPSSLSASALSRIADLPRPWTVILLGGHSRPYRFDVPSAHALADRANALAAERGGSVLVIQSPRTPASCVRIIASRLSGRTYVYDPLADENPYQRLLVAADYFVVTNDSAMMVAEVLVARKPLEIFELARRPDWRYACAQWWERRGQERPWLARMLAALRDVGLVQSTRDLREYYHRLQALEVFTATGIAAAVAQQEQQETISRILSVLF